MLKFIFLHNWYICSSQLRSSFTRKPRYLALFTSSIWLASRFMENWSRFNYCSCILLPMINTADFSLLIVNLFLNYHWYIYYQQIAVIWMVDHHWLLQRFKLIHHQHICLKTHPSVVKLTTSLINNNIIRGLIPSPVVPHCKLPKIRNSNVEKNTIFWRFFR